MAKDKISDYSATANSNTDIAGINIDEGCAPSGINDAIRTLMKQLKDFQQGTQGDSFNGPVGSTTRSTGAFTSLSTTGDITIDNGNADGGQLLLASSGYSNWGVDNFSGNFRLYYNTTEMMRLNSSGNLGLGVTPSAWSSAYKIFEMPNGVSLGSYSAGATPITYLNTNVYDNGTDYIYKVTGYASRYVQSSGQHAWYNAASGSAGGTITFTQAMTLDASGNLLVRGTSAGAAGTNQYTAGSLCLGGSAVTAGYKYCVINVDNGGSGSGLSYQYAGAERAAIFWNQSNDRLFAFVGNASTGVYMANSGTSWTSNSDERLKTDLVPIENAAQKVSTLRAVTGRYKTDAEGVSRSFLIAQDVRAVLPEAVSIGSMPMSEDKTDYLGVSYTDVIPLLVAAIKELKATVDAQQVEIDTLKGQA